MLGIKGYYICASSKILKQIELMKVLKLWIAHSFKGFPQLHVP